MLISIFDQLVFVSLVLTALVVSAIAQASPPPHHDGNGPRYLPLATAIHARPPARNAPALGFNPQ